MNAVPFRTGSEDQAEPLIRFQEVTKIYGQGANRVIALDRVNLDIRDGEFVAIMGPSGSGKSTTMNILGCLDVPTRGHFWFKGLSAGKLSRDQRALLRRYYLGFVFQGFNLLNRTSALENVELPLVYRGLTPAERKEKALKALDLVDLGNRARHNPAELSGGQQQRVAIARALAAEPSVLLADEPTGNLDSSRSREIMELLVSLNKSLGLTAIMVTHEERMAGYADRIIRFVDGRIQKDQDPSEEGI